MGIRPAPRNFDALIFGYYEGDRLYIPQEPAMDSRRLEEHNCIVASRAWRSRSVRS